MDTTSSLPSPIPASSLFRDLLQRDLFQQMWKFMSVGFVNVALSTLIYGVSYFHLSSLIPDVQERLLAANSIAFLITVTNAFLLNSRITFKQKHAGAPEYIRYGLVNIAGFAINSFLLITFARFIASLRHETVQQMDRSFHLGHWIAFFCAVGCSFFWNFFASRHWVFRHDR